MDTIDRAYLAAQTFGDDDLARELLILFVAQCRRVMPALSDPGRPHAARADLAHTLKGSAAGIGARAVAEACGPVEAPLRDGREPDLAELSAAVAQALQAAHAPI